MQKHDAIIYECNNNYYFIQKSKQSLNAAVSATENTALTQKLSMDASAETVGKALVESLNNFGKIAPKFSPWQLKELRSQLCKWTEAKTHPFLMKNSRLVAAVKDFQHESISIIPFDNFNINAWETILEDRAISLPIDSTPVEIGKAIKMAFNISTYHPQKK